MRAVAATGGATTSEGVNVILPIVFSAVADDVAIGPPAARPGAAFGIAFFAANSESRLAR
jgi:hypothetical protein